MEGLFLNFYGHAVSKSRRLLRNFQKKICAEIDKYWQPRCGPDWDRTRPLSDRTTKTWTCTHSPTLWYI